MIRTAIIRTKLKSGSKWHFSAKGVTAPYRNADRQKAVNRVAHKYGTGTGTAYKVSEAYLPSRILLMYNE